MTSVEWDNADIDRSRAGDEDAFRRLIDCHTPQVARMMWRFTRDPREHAELIQDVFVEVWMSLPRYQPVAPFAHWLSRIATRTGYSFWKRVRRSEREHALAPETLALVADPDGEKDFEKLSAVDAGNVAFELLAALPPRDRLVLTLRFVEEKSVEETAELAGWTQVMVKVQTWRARNKLKHLFERWQQEGKHGQ